MGWARLRLNLWFDLPTSERNDHGQGAGGPAAGAAVASKRAACSDPTGRSSTTSVRVRRSARLVDASLDQRPLLAGQMVADRPEGRVESALDRSAAAPFS
jgi:hypothetical protein